MMLSELHIRNYVLIENTSIRFSKGLNVLTGETGSGKSLIFDCIQIVLGGKFSKDSIRNGKERAGVQALFLMDEKDGALRKQLEAYGIIPEEDGILLVSREVSRSGHAVVRINGQLATVSMLRELSVFWAEIVGQNEHQKLLSSQNHLRILDSAEEASVILHNEVKNRAEHLKKLKIEIETMKSDSMEKERRIDLLKYQTEEILSQNLKNDEEDELKARRAKYMNMGRIRENAQQIYSLLFEGCEEFGGAVDALRQGANCCDEIMKVDPSFASIGTEIQSHVYPLEDLKFDLRDYMDSLETDPLELEQIEERLDGIQSLKRKYGQTISEILEYCSNAEQELERLENMEKYSQDLEDAYAAEFLLYQKASDQLSSIRKKTAEMLEGKIEAELHALNMNAACFQIRIKTKRDVVHPNGFDTVEFYISTNTGEEFKPLSRIASGGELSRTILAIKNALFTQEDGQILIFDEIDVGIGGVTADIVGQKLKTLSKRNQLILISHIPQIVAYVDNHILVEKYAENGLTYSVSSVLDKANSVREIAKMISGREVTEQDIKYTKKMMKEKGE